MQTELDLEVLLETDDGDGLWHGAHLECQYDRDFVTLVCGIQTAWINYAENSDLPDCPTCHGPEPTCPVCGVSLVRGPQ